MKRTTTQKLRNHTHITVDDADMRQEERIFLHDDEVRRGKKKPEKRRQKIELDKAMQVGLIIHACK